MQNDVGYYSGQVTFPSTDGAPFCYYVDDSANLLMWQF